MLNHRRPPNRARNVPAGDHDDEQVALLSLSSVADGAGPPVYSERESSDNRWPTRGEHLSEVGSTQEAVAYLPFHNLAHSTRTIGSSAQLTSRHNQLSDISPSNSINFSDPTSASYGRQNFIYYTVQPGDTLHNLSVKYSCPVASIKRINNLWSDQEFHALSKIKLPVGKFNLIANVIEEEEAHKSVNKSPNSIPQTSNYTNSSSFQQEQFIGDTRVSGDPISISKLHQSSQPQPPTLLCENSATDSVFKKLDLNIEKARSAARHYDNHANAILQSLVDSGNRVDEVEHEDLNILIARQQAETLLNDMTEFGMTYTGLILFIFIVCLIFPIAYVIYLEETHHATRHE